MTAKPVRPSCTNNFLDSVPTTPPPVSPCPPPPPLPQASQQPLEVFALHSSIDVDECILSMEAVTGSRRKVVLATNIAESSVTIRNVKYVIDTCCSNHVSWEQVGQTERAAIVWASQSQCKQRAGRTGRTCAGTVFRLLPRSAYLKLPKHDVPAVLSRSLRRETLMLSCSDSKLMADPYRVFSTCLDPPPPSVVSDAAAYLERVDAVGRATDRGGAPKLAPTAYGRHVSLVPLPADIVLTLS